MKTRAERFIEGLVEKPQELVNTVDDWDNDTLHWEIGNRKLTYNPHYVLGTECYWCEKPLDSIDDEVQNLDGILFCTPACVQEWYDTEWKQPQPKNILGPHPWDGQRDGIVSKCNCGAWKTTYRAYYPSYQGANAERCLKNVIGQTQEPRKTIAEAIEAEKEELVLWTSDLGKVRCPNCIQDAAQVIVEE